MSFLISSFAMADNECGAGSKTKIDNNHIYAEVISQSNMDLELIVLKKYQYGYSIKIVGGYDYDLSNMPSCSSEELSGVRWSQRDRLATHWTSGGSSSFSAGYRICLYNARNDIVDSYVICNAEVGD
jgi:hypothetical protein